MVKKIIPNFEATLRLLGCLALTTFFLSTIPGARAEEKGGTVLSYEDALKALQKTKQHSQAAQGWGQRRTISVPKGVDPNKLIKKKVIKVPSVEGIKSATTTPTNVTPVRVNGPISDGAPPPASTPAPAPAAKKTKKQNGGWDWLSSSDTAKKSSSLNKTSQAVPNVNNFPANKSFQPNKKSSMKTMYEAPVTKAPQKTKAPVPTASKPVQNEDQKVNLLDLGNENTKVTKAPVQKAQPKQTAAELYNRAVKSHLKGRLSEAIADYSSALKADPKMGSAHCNLGQIYNQQHHFDMAIAEFRKALEVNPKDEHAYNGMGAALRGKKDYDGAIQNWKTAVSIKPDLATAHYNLGAVYEVKNDIDKALQAYREAVKYDYRLGEANYRIGLIMVKKNRLPDAREEFKKALKVSNKASYSPDARSRLASIEQKLR